MSFVWGLIVGLIAGGSAIGWVMWNKADKLREKAKNYGVNL